MARITKETKAEVRKRLLETAAREFADHGLDGANVDRIAVTAGYAKGTIYNYFKSKLELFAEVLAVGCDQAVERYSSVPHTGSVRDCLVALAAADVAVIQEEERFFQVVVREAMSFRAETYPVIVEQLTPYVAIVEEVLARGVADGEIRTDRPTGQLALAFVGVLAVLYVQHWGSGGAWPTQEEIPEFAVTLFLEGAGARPASPKPRRRRTPTKEKSP
jgi:AcrR family transcriptional regulator